MHKLLKTHFGYDSFRPLQKEIIDRVMSGQDAFVLMPTGGGKSLCFQLPALALDGITIVVSPLIALMKDQVDALLANGVSAAFLNSSLTISEQTSVMDQAKSGKLTILYLAPERIGSYGFSDFLASLKINLLAIDEAHCISEWGHDFRPDYRSLRNLRMKLTRVPVIALTATATPRVQQDILSELNMKKESVFISSFNRENLHYSVRPKYKGTAQLLEILDSHKDESVIIYCYSRKNTEEIARSLLNAGLNALPYHAGLQKNVRIRTQEKFIRDEIQIIVATIAFGMGIDKPDVRMVIHMDLPKTIEGYYQETGRAGRDGLPGECVLFYTYADRRKQDFFINQIEDEDEKKLAVQKLDDVLFYCQSEACRRFFLLMYFGESDAPTSCNACDNCTTPEVELAEATDISQKILSAVLRTGERFGITHVCDVLRGSKKKRILELRHDELSVHGIARNVPIDVLREYMYSLKKLKYIVQSQGEYPTIQVSKKGKQALVSGNDILLPKPQTINVIQKSAKSDSPLEYNVEMFEKLRTLRREIATDMNVPPFIIFGDKSLHEMAHCLPSNFESFSQLFGVGERKLEAFGEQFLNCIIEHTREHGLEEKPTQKNNNTQFSQISNKPSSTLLETKKLLEKELSLKEITTQRSLTHGTIIQHIEKLVRANEHPTINHIKPNKKQFELIKNALVTSGPTLTSVFKSLDEKYSYDELRLVRLFL